MALVAASLLAVRADDILDRWARSAAAIALGTLLAHTLPFVWLPGLVACSYHLWPAPKAASLPTKNSPTNVYKCLI